MSEQGQPSSWFGDLNDALETEAEAAANAKEATAGINKALPSFARILRAFLWARIAMGLLTVVGILLLWLIGYHLPNWAWPLGLGYLAVTISPWVWLKRQGRTPNRLSRRYAVATIGADIALFGLLHYLSGSGLNSQALLVMPVLMAAVLMRRVTALGVAAASSIVLLATAWLTVFTSPADLMAALTQAGLTGFGLFAVAGLASELALRLAREERSARGSQEAAKRQSLLNKLVLDEMTVGVLVIDRHGSVRSANPAARSLLAFNNDAPHTPFPLVSVATWRPLVSAIERALEQPGINETGQDITLSIDDGNAREIRLRTRFTKDPEGGRLQDVCVLFLEDLRIVRQRQRQDKLAAMGRMSAGIAHEVRNPLAAIAQANALLAEDAQTPTQRRLTQMVADNVTRLKGIVDDILTVAPGVRPPAPPLDIVSAVASICQEWRQINRLATDASSPLNIEVADVLMAPGGVRPRVRFEQEHLQRVMVNLLDNALRHQSNTAGAIKVLLSISDPTSNASPHVQVSVLSDGAAITPETERSLFEPFFSTRSRGTGLGLYICRELCERHGAAIDYRQHLSTSRHTNEFFITIPIDLPGRSQPDA